MRHVRPALVIGIILGLGIVWLSYEYGGMQAGFNRFEAAADVTELREQIEAQAEEIEALRQQLAVQETSSDIDEGAYDEIEVRLLELQTQVADQQKDLAFYRGIMAPESQAEGLQLKEIELQTLSEPNVYRMHLILVQAINHSRIVSGEVRVFVEGNQGNDAASFDLTELRVEGQGNDPLAFSFRYFQNLERDIRLPDNFLPERINIEVVPNRRSSRTIRETFDWTVQDG